MNTDKIYTPEELAERWACNLETVYRMIARSELRTFRVGRMLRITAAEVSRYESGQTATAE